VADDLLDSAGVRREGCAGRCFACRTGPCGLLLPSEFAVSIIRQVDGARLRLIAVRGLLRIQVAEQIDEAFEVWDRRSRRV
jgi:hypothetical protein